MLKKILSRYFCRQFYPTNRKNWYASKGYIGKDDKEIFDHFIATQANKNLKSKSGIESKFFYEFEGLTLERIKIPSGAYMLDGVSISNAQSLNPKGVIDSHAPLPGTGITMIMFQGRSEYYESRFRDMALLSKHTGAKVVGFNPKGFHSSTGQTKILKDIVDDGVAVVEYILRQNIPASNIIMMGNSLGAAVQEMVCKRVEKERAISGFRQINSNSFRTLSAVLASRLNRWLSNDMAITRHRTLTGKQEIEGFCAVANCYPDEVCKDPSSRSQMRRGSSGIRFTGELIEQILHKLLSYSNWEIEVDEDFYTAGPMRLVLTRLGDKTILPSASYCSAIDKASDIDHMAKSNQDYIIDYKHLLMHGHLIHKPEKQDLHLHKKSTARYDDPHAFSLNKFVSAHQENYSVFDIINYYISASNRIVKKI